ncbi:MAG: hypothetical protein LBU83_00945 [Bacteroidales bacterium]|jgi:hypothetical protein|nr:hypothetical protein [Bacteroidales bacterium]
MKNLLKISILLTAMLIALAGCEKESTSNGGGGNNGGGGGGVSGSIDPNLIGVWSNNGLPYTLFSTTYAHHTTALGELVESITTEIHVSGTIFVDIYREDGTAMSLFLNQDAYQWSTFNYTTNDGLIYRSNIVATYNNKKTPSQNYENKHFPDTREWYKVKVNTSGKTIYTITPTLYDYTDIDDYIENDFPFWYFKLEPEEE